MPAFLNQPIPEQDMTIYDQLLKLPNLEELHIYSGDGACFYGPNRHDASLSQFSNLQSLAVHEIDWLNFNDHELEKALVASPGLRHLGLSCGVYNEYISENDLLFHLALYFSRLRRQHRLPPLQLESLHLGSCAMPWMYTPNPFYKDRTLRENDYLREITDITSLECLRLDNIQRHYPCYEQVVPYRHIVPSMFTGACNLRSLTVQRLGPDILSLIQLVLHEQASRQISPVPKLDTLQVLLYGRTLRWEEEDFEESIMWDYGPDVVDPSVPIYSVPLQDTGYHWKRLCYSGFSKPYLNPERVTKAAELLRYVAQCSKLEELAVPIHSRDELEMLKEEVLPKLPHLRVLHLPWGDLADFLEGLDTPEPLNPSYHIPNFTEQQAEEYEKQNVQIEQDQERRRIAIVRELFLYHHQLRVQHPHMSPLEHVAINEEAYTLEPRTQEQDSEEEDNNPYLLPDGSTIIRLGLEAAREVGIVDILYTRRLCRGDDDDW